MTSQMSATRRSERDLNLNVRHGALTTRSTVAFFVGTFALSWSIGALLVVFPGQVEAIFGPMGYTNPAFILLVYAPGFVGLYMVCHHYGLRGLASFLRRFTLWRVPGRWSALFLLGMPAVFYAGAAITGNANDFPFDPWYGVLPALIPAFLIGPIEELGWWGGATTAATPLRTAVGQSDRRCGHDPERKALYRGAPARHRQ